MNMLTPISDDKISQILDNKGAEKTAKWLIDQYIKDILNSGLTSQDLADSDIFNNGIVEVVECLDILNFDDAKHVAKETAENMINEEGVESNETEEY